MNRYGLCLFPVLIVAAGCDKSPEDFFKSPERSLAAGNEYYEKGELGQAIAAYTEAIRLKPDFALAYACRGYVLAEKKEWDKAIADYTEAVRLNPGDARSYLYRGAAHANKKEWDKVIADCTEAIRLKPDLALAHFWRGNARAEKGERELAIIDFTETIRLKPDLALAHAGRGAARTEKGEWELGIADCTEAIRLKPGYAPAYDCRSRGYLNTQDAEKAAMDLAMWRRLTGKESASVKSVDLDMTMKTVRIKDVVYDRLARGSDKTVEDTVRVLHSATVSAGWSSELDTKARISAHWAEIDAAIRKRIEGSTSVTYQVQTERRRSIKLEGDRMTGKVRVVWVERYRTGRVTVTAGGREVVVPFEFKDDFDLLTEDVVE